MCQQFAILALRRVPKVFLTDRQRKTCQQPDQRLYRTSRLHGHLRPVLLVPRSHRPVAREGTGETVCYRLHLPRQFCPTAASLHECQNLLLEEEVRPAVLAEEPRDSLPEDRQTLKTTRSSLYQDINSQY